MRVPVILFLLGCAMTGLALVWSGGRLSDLTLLALIFALAGLVLLPVAAVGRWARRRGGKAGRWIVVDGSNVMHWKDQTPQIATVIAVVQALRARGLTPGVVFDANAGYKIGGRYKGDREMARLLGLPRSRVLVVPKGTPADPWLLAAARDLGARVVTNDRFRDWAAAHPEVTEPGFLIRGGYRDGALWLDETAVAVAVPA